jgi:hypothetical protein
MDFVEAASCAARRGWIIFREILPNASPLNAELGLRHLMVLFCPLLLGLGGSAGSRLGRHGEGEQGIVFGIPADPAARCAAGSPSTCGGLILNRTTSLKEAVVAETFWKSAISRSARPSTRPARIMAIVIVDGVSACKRQGARPDR